MKDMMEEAADNHGVISERVSEQARMHERQREKFTFLFKRNTCEGHKERDDSGETGE